MSPAILSPRWSIRPFVAPNAPGNSHGIYFIVPSGLIARNFVELTTPGNCKFTIILPASSAETPIPKVKGSLSSGLIVALFSVSHVFTSYSSTLPVASQTSTLPVALFAIRACLPSWPHELEPPAVYPFIECSQSRVILPVMVCAFTEPANIAAAPRSKNFFIIEKFSLLINC